MPEIIKNDTDIVVNDCPECRKCVGTFEECSCFDEEVTYYEIEQSQEEIMKQIIEL